MKKEHLVLVAAIVFGICFIWALASIVNDAIGIWTMTQTELHQIHVPRSPNAAVNLFELHVCIFLMHTFMYYRKIQDGQKSSNVSQWHQGMV